jgi:hypothetical protein
MRTAPDSDAVLEALALSAIAVEARAKACAIPLLLKFQEAATGAAPSAAGEQG